MQWAEELGGATRWMEVSQWGDNKDKDKDKRKHKYKDKRQTQTQIQRQSRSDKNWVVQGDGGGLSQRARQQRALAVADNLSK